MCAQNSRLSVRWRLGVRPAQAARPTPGEWHVVLLLAATLSSALSGGEAIVSASRLPAVVDRALGLIQGKGIVAHARELCDPDYHGRAAGSKGARSAADYIISQFREIGLRAGGSAGSYIQSFKIRRGYRMAGRMEVTMAGEPLGEFKLGQDYMPIHLPNGQAEIAAECVLAGYGISSEALNFDEYADIDAKGKVAIVFSGTPWSPKTWAWIQRTVDTKAFEKLGYKARNAAAHGAVCLLVVDDPAGWRKQVRVAEQLRLPEKRFPLESPIPIVHVTREFVAKATTLSLAELRLLSIDISQDQAPQSMPLRARRLSLRMSLSGSARLGRNIVGVLPGQDETLQREAVVYGAHYDHLGEGDKAIFFGANDNAAGVGALIAIARAFRALPSPPNRTVVFVAFDAEEIGRLGSKHYVGKPCLPTKHTALMINFDMIGRNEPDHIYAVGTRSSDGLHRLHQDANRHVGLRLTHPLSFRLGRSDHSPFYHAGVPIMYLFGGLDRDYNTPRDTWDKLIPDKVGKVARLAFLTGLEAAERAERLKFRRSEDGETPPGLDELMRRRTQNR